jgi:hypothetical protein
MFFLVVHYSVPTYHLSEIWAPGLDEASAPSAATQKPILLELVIALFLGVRRRIPE